MEVQSPLAAIEEVHGYFVAAVVAVAIPVIAFGGVERLVHVADQMDEHLEREDSRLGRLSRVSQGLLEVLDPEDDAIVVVAVAIGVVVRGGDRDCRRNASCE